MTDGPNHSGEWIQPGDPTWTVVKHPEGWRYYWFGPYRIVTDTLRVPIEPNILSRDEEIFFEDQKYFNINHERQVKLLSHELKSHLLLCRQKYWEYIMAHPAHLSKSQVQNIVQTGGREALDYLKQCTQTALLPSETPMTVFSLGRSKELTELLNSVMVDNNDVMIENASEKCLASLVLRHKQGLATLVSNPPNNDNWHSTTRSGHEKASYLLRQNIELINHLFDFFNKPPMEWVNQVAKDSIMLSVYKALITALHELLKWRDAGKGTPCVAAIDVISRHIQEFRSAEFTDENNILPFIRSVLDMIHSPGSTPDAPKTIFTHNLPLLTKELVTLLVGILVMERDLDDYPSLRFMFLIAKEPDWKTHNFLQNVPELVTFLDNIVEHLLPEIGLPVKQLQAKSMELRLGRQQTESTELVDILSYFAQILTSDLGVTFAERGGRMSATMALVNDGLVTAFYHLIDKTNTRKITSNFLVYYLYKLEWELFTDLSDGPNLRSTVPVSMIAGILVQKYRSYNARRFWKVDRDGFHEWSRSKAGGTDNIFAQFLTDSCFYFLTVLCLFAPRRYFKIILEVDSMFLTGNEWRSHIQKLADDWSAFNLLSTVILAAAVSYLSVQDLGPVATIAVLISILGALGSVLAGLYCLAYYRTYTPEVDSTNVADVDRYSGNLTDHGKYRPKYFAIILSLPEVFLVWSIVSFTVTTIAFNFGNANQAAPGGSFGVLAVLLAVAIGFGLVISALWYMWGQGSLMSTVRRTFSMKKTVEAA